MGNPPQVLLTRFRITLALSRGETRMFDEDEEEEEEEDWDEEDVEEEEEEEE